MITYFSKQIRTNKNLKELNVSLYRLLYRKENNYFPFFPFCLFDSEYYVYLKKRIKYPYDGEINQTDFTFDNQLSLDSTRHIKIKGKITPEIDCTVIQLNFQTSLVTIIAYITAILYGTWTLIIDGNPTFLLVLPFLIVNEILVTTRNFKRIKNQATSP